MEKNIDNEAKDEVLTTHKPIPMNIANKVMKSICKIIIINNSGNNSFGTGFFLRISDSLKCLITNYHVLNPVLIHFNIEIEIWNKEKMILKENDFYIKYFEKPKDITIMIIKDLDNMNKKIEFLDYDANYSQKGYLIYKGADVFSIHHPFGDDAACASGNIININGYEFDHKIPTEEGSSGCPIILLNNNINFVQVIGIHKKGNKKNHINSGTFIGEIIDEINNDAKINFNNNPKNTLVKELNKNKNENNMKKKNAIQNKKIEESNYIVAEIDIKENDINKDIRVINSYEEYRRKESYYPKLEENLKNEEEIKECEIKINDKSIQFNYFHQFNKKGINQIKYIFKNSLKKQILYSLIAKI